MGDVALTKVWDGEGTLFDVVCFKRQKNKKVGKIGR